MRRDHSKLLVTGLLAASLAACGSPWGGGSSSNATGGDVPPPTTYEFDATVSSDVNIIEHDRYQGELYAPSAAAQAVALSGKFRLYGSRLVVQAVTP